MADDGANRTMRRKRRNAPRLRVVTGWVEALEEVDLELVDHGSRAYLHRKACAAPDGPCECAVVLIGPAVRAHDAGWQ